MRKLVAVFLLCFIPVFGQCKLTAEQQTAIAVVRGFDDEHKIDATGSGFYIAPQYLLTACHVVYKNDDRRRPYYAKRVYIDGVPAQVIRFDPDIDVALLYCSAANHVNLPLTGLAPYISQPVGVYGRFASEIATTKGKTTGFDNTFFEATAKVRSGYSGGPVESDGVVIGLLSQRTMKGSYAVFISAYRIANWLKSSGYGYLVQTPNK
jgi:S1-C subfamily serine protease